MKNIEQKILFTFTNTEIRREKFEPSPHINITKGFLYLTFFSIFSLLFFNISYNLERLIGLYVFFSSIFFIMLFIMTYDSYKISYFKYYTLQAKYLKKFKKEFGSLENILFIYNKLKSLDEPIKNSDFYKFNLESKEFFDNLKSKKEEEIEVINEKYKLEKMKKIKNILKEKAVY